MKSPLTSKELSLIVDVFRRHPEIESVRLFGSRTNGTNTQNSDVDLAVWGQVDALRAESNAAEIDELPLPYQFDVQPFALVSLQALREHIERVDLEIYPVITRR